MADATALKQLQKGASAWNAWRGKAQFRAVDLTGADLRGRKLNEFSFLRADLTGADLRGAQLERAHLKDAMLRGALLEHANLEAVNARDAVFDEVIAPGANFEVATLRGASFRSACLSGARFHRAYLRETDLTRADLSGAWLRFATLDNARCEHTNFAGADLRHSAMVDADLRGATLTDVAVFGISAWGVAVDAATRQDLIVTNDRGGSAGQLRANDLQTAQLLSLMLDGVGVRSLINAVNSKLVMILGSFAPDEKAVLDALRNALRAQGYVAVLFDFERPSERDYAETILTLAGMSRFVVADFTNAKEVRAEVAQIRTQFRRLPILPIARARTPLPITMTNVFSTDEISAIVRYQDSDDLLRLLQDSIIERAESQSARIAEELARVEAALRGV